MFDGLLEFIKHGEKLGFALLVASGGTLALNGLGIWPATKVDDAHLVWLTFAALLGAALLLSGLWRWTTGLFSALTGYVSIWSDRRTAVLNLPKLVPDERNAIAWLLHNNYGRLNANIYKAPFAGLVRKHILLTTDGAFPEQVLELNPTILKCKADALAFLKIDNEILSGEAPWLESPLGWMGR